MEMLVKLWVMWNIEKCLIFSIRIFLLSLLYKCSHLDSHRMFKAKFSVFIMKMQRTLEN